MLTNTIEQDPSNYLTYYKRATAYLSLGRTNAAVEDFSKILDLKPDFEKALMQRARIYAKEGDFELAQKDLEKYLESHPKDAEATTLVGIYTSDLRELQCWLILFIYPSYKMWARQQQQWRVLKRQRKRISLMNAFSLHPRWHPLHLNFLVYVNYELVAILPREKLKKLQEIWRKLYLVFQFGIKLLKSGNHSILDVLPILFLPIPTHLSFLPR